MTEYEIVDEPPGGPRSSQQHSRIDFLNWLRAHPGKWGVYPGTQKRHSNYGPLQQFLKANGMEATTRTSDGRARLYARAPQPKRSTR